MSSTTLLAGLGLNLVTGALLAYVGLLILRRPATLEERGALIAFGTWWLAAGVVVFSLGFHTVAWYLGWRDETPHIFVSFLRLAVLSVAVASLLYYLLYLFTGRARVGWGVALFGVAYLSFTQWYLTQVAPWDLVETTYDVRLQSIDDAPRVLSLVFAAFTAGPILGGCVAYASLLLRIREATPRFRVGLVSLAILQLFVWILVGIVLQWSQYDWYPLSYEVPGLAAAVLVLVAYRPPAWLQRAWGVRPLLVSASGK